jgi:dihydropteroate synthase
MIDIGAESTRPGFAPVTPEAQWARMERVLPALIEDVGLPVSVDTTHASVARKCLALGAAVVNDQSALRADPAMAGLVAESGALLVAMHFCEAVDPARDLLAHMLDFFGETLERARKAGVERAKIILDPGVGFGKTPQQNVQAIAATAQLRETFGLPVLVGLSRKSFIGALTGAPVGERLAGTLAAHLAARARGAAIFRVHDVAEHAQAFKIWAAIADA